MTSVNTVYVMKIIRTGFLTIWSRERKQNVQVHIFTLKYNETIKSLLLNGPYSHSVISGDPTTETPFEPENEGAAALVWLRHPLQSSPCTVVLPPTWLCGELQHSPTDLNRAVLVVRSFPVNRGWSAKAEVHPLLLTAVTCYNYVWKEWLVLALSVRFSPEYWKVEMWRKLLVKLNVYKTKTSLFISVNYYFIIYSDDYFLSDWFFAF